MHMNLSLARGITKLMVIKIMLLEKKDYEHQHGGLSKIAHFLKTSRKKVILFSNVLQKKKYNRPADKIIMAKLKYAHESFIGKGDN